MSKCKECGQDIPEPPFVATQEWIDEVVAKRECTSKHILLHAFGLSYKTYFVSDDYRDSSGMMSNWQEHWHDSNGKNAFPKDYERDPKLIPDLIDKYQDLKGMSCHLPRVMGDGFQFALCKEIVNAWVDKHLKDYPQLEFESKGAKSKG